MKKLLSILLASLMLFSLGAAAFAEEVPVYSEDDQVPWTIFVHLDGADLESDYGCASDNLMQMIDATSYGNVRFVVQTGGATEWQSGIDPNAIERYEILGGDTALVDSQPDASMGDAQTLASFLQWGLSNYSSPYYGLVMWDHGSGSINGVCFDDKFNGQSLTLTAIQSALQSVSSLLPNGFEFVGFDACLMGTVETAAVLAPFARYMIGSQETEPGTGWDYTAIGTCLAAYPDADGITLGTAICDGFYDSCEENDCSESATLSLIDLSRIPALRVAFDAYAKDIYTAMEKGNGFTPISRSISSADNFGGNNRNEGYTNMVDLGGLIAAGREWSANADSASEALSDCVLYQVKGSNHTIASGLSVYYPLQVQGSQELSIFKDVCISAYYLGVVDKVAYGYANGGNMDNYDADSVVPGEIDQWAQAGGDESAYNQYFQDANWSYLDALSEDYQSTAISFAVPPSFDENGTYGFVLDEDGLNNTDSVEAIVYLLSPDGDYINLGSTTDIICDWETGTVVDNFDGYWFALPDGQPLSIYPVSECDGYDLFTTPVLLNGEQTNLRFAWDYTNEQIYIVDVWDGIEDGGYSSRPTVSLKPGDVITPLYDAYESGDFDDVFFTGQPYTYTGSNDLYFDLLPEGDYLYSFCINDIYGGFWYSDAVNFTFTDGAVYYDNAA